MKCSKIIPSRVNELRNAMSREGIFAYMVPTADHHNSEYVHNHFKCREYLSGFTGSNGTLVVMPDFAGLWTDGRYFIQAECELAGSGIALFKMGEPGVPTIKEFLMENMPKASTLGFDGRVITASEGYGFEKTLLTKEIGLKTDLDLVGEIWTDRPALPCEKIIIIPDDISGEKSECKIARVRNELKNKNCESTILSKLDDIAWILNIRGADIECNPVALSYLYISMQETILFIQGDELSLDSRAFLKNSGIKISEYAQFADFLSGGSFDGRILIDPNNISFSVAKRIEKTGKVVKAPNPTESMKSVKNPVELDNLRKVYIRDSACVARYIYWLKNNIGKTPINEYTAGKKLDSMREELPGFMELSFPTIAAFGENGAIIHYEATEDNNKELTPEGFFMVDSGGQYMGGTTDVTRTIVLGPVSDEMRKYFTLTLVGMLRLGNVVFMRGCTGRNLDICAREPLWRSGIDFKHGTGHGIGYILNVHEGPQNIRWKYVQGAKEAILEPGMIVSDEPGVYLENKFGLRIENIVEVVSRQKNDDGEFLAFSHLTYVPVDLDAVDTEYMTSEDVILLNNYHRLVFDKISKYMETEEELRWLTDATRAIEK